MNDSAEGPLMGAQSRPVTQADGEGRLDRWFKRHFPDVPTVRVQKMCRTGQIRVDGRRAKANDHVRPGMIVRVPPLRAMLPGDAEGGDAQAAADRERRDRQTLESMVLWRDEHMAILNKPAGLPVQGGGKGRSLDELLLAWGDEDPALRPRLVHRLDQETSGCLAVAMNAAAAQALTGAFRDRGTVRKEYWALTLGVPQLTRGEINLPLARGQHGRGQRVFIDDQLGKAAQTRYHVADQAGRKIAFIRAEPMTGRTHQLRVHLSAIGCPILGDIKYSRSEEWPELSGEKIKRLHLHARRLAVPHPLNAAQRIEATAPLGSRLAASWAHFEFSDRLNDPLYPGDEPEDEL